MTGMEEFIEHAVDLRVNGLITVEELAEMIAKEYAKLWARGQILGIVTAKGDG